MSAAQAVSLTLTDSKRHRLKKIAYGHKTPRQARQRATTVLPTARGRSNARISAQTRLHMDTMRTWRDRCATGGLPALADHKRSGRPASFTALQVTEVKAPACRLPAETGASLSRWSCPGPAREVASQPGGLVRGPFRHTIKSYVRPAHHRSGTKPRLNVQMTARSHG